MDWNERPAWFDCKHENSTVKFCVDEESRSLSFVLFCEQCQSDAVMIEKVSEEQVNQLKEETFGFLKRELTTHRKHLFNRAKCFSGLREDSDRWTEFIQSNKDLIDMSKELTEFCDERLDELITEDELEPEAKLILVTTFVMHRFAMMVDMDIHLTYYAAFFAALKNQSLPTDAFWEPKFEFPPQSLVYRKEKT